MFKDKSVYYRNALVRSNYFNNYLNIKQDNSFLIKFYENLLLGKNNDLHSRDLIVKKLIMKVKEKIMNAKIIDDLIETESKKRTFK